MSDEMIDPIRALSPDDIVRVMAYSNAALPDGDPRKITRRDVERLREGAAVMPTEGWRNEEDFVLQLAAKLAALLPPD